jgi:hypothetical protein
MSLSAAVPQFRVWPALAAGMLAIPGAASAQLFDFTIQPSQSGLQSSLSFSIPSTGTMIGNWDQVNNPTGTRTKPGLLGTFGPTENVAVPTSVTTSLSGPVNSSSSGAFVFGLDSATGTAQMTSYNSNLLHSGPVALPIVLTLLYDSFRTRTPDSTFPGGIPLPIPFGDASLTALTLQQVGGGAGTLVQTAPNQYEFTVAPVVLLTAHFTALGQPFIIPGAPTAIVLQGQVTIENQTAILSSVRPFEFQEQFPVNQPLPQFPFELPTVLPPGGTAHLLMDLTIGTISSSFAGTETLHATGVLVPAPVGAVLLVMGGMFTARRRR